MNHLTITISSQPGHFAGAGQCSMAGPPPSATPPAERSTPSGTTVDHNGSSVLLRHRSIETVDNNRSEAEGKRALHAALTALAENRDLAAHLHTLREYYGSLTWLAPRLEKTVREHPELLRCERDWIDVLKEHPHLLDRVPSLFLTDTLYATVIVSARTCADLPPSMPVARKKSICALACATSCGLLIEGVPNAYKTPELYTVACAKFTYMFNCVPDKYRSAELCAMVFNSAPQLFAHLAKSQRSPQLARLACKKNGLMLAFVEPSERTPSLCHLACQAHGQALPHVPATVLRRHPELYTIACGSDGRALQWVPKERHSATLYRIAARSHPDALPLLLKIFRDNGSLDGCDTLLLLKELYACACLHSGAALRHVPLPYRTAELCFMAFNAPAGHLEAFAAIPVELRSQKMYERVCAEESKWLANLPAHINHQPLDRIAAAHAGSVALLYIRPARRTPAVCKAALYRDAMCMELVPEQHLNLELLLAWEENWSADLLRRARTVLCDAQLSLFVTLMVCRNSQIQTQILTCADLPWPIKADVIRFLTNGEAPCALERQHGFEALQSRNMPLRWQMPNRGAYTLLKACYQDYEPPQRQAGRAVEEFIAAQLSTFRSCRRLPKGQQPDLCHRGQLKGGRTVKVDEGETALYYKFQKQGESLTTLVREGLMHRYRKEHPDSLMARLVSDLPRDPVFFELDEQNWPADLNEWPDVPKKLSRDGRRYINIYRYRASADYSRYAHQPDSGSHNPYQKPEAGILAACHDMGLFAAHGLALTSLLPAFHDSETGRGWLLLHSLLGYRPFGALPGTFGAWNTEATEFCDIGYSGLRDVGDFEPFAAIDSLFGKKDVSRWAQPLPVRDRLAFINTACENLLAAVLVRARLRQQSPDYHFDNDVAVAETATFVGEVCRQFLIGMGGQKDSRELVQSVLKVDSADVQAWLDRSASEILYWTAAQPDYDSPDTPAFAKDDRLWDHADCYALHLRRTGKLSAKLYPDDVYRPTKRYPEDFHNRDKRLNLGANNTVFPLVSLVKGFMQLGVGLLSSPELFERN